MLKINHDLVSSFYGIHDLTNIYKALDVQVESFKKKTGIDCIEGCGKCCEISSNNIEVSVLEVVPLSHYLWETGEGELFLDKISKTDNRSPCVLYHVNHLKQRKGRCYAYSLRPLICRLFGFSATQDKYGKPVMVFCSTIKKSKPYIGEDIKRMIHQGLDVPIYSTYARRISFLNPIYSHQCHPMNEAIKIAIEVVGYRMTYPTSQS